MVFGGLGQNTWHLTDGSFPVLVSSHMPAFPQELLRLCTLMRVIAFLPSGLQTAEKKLYGEEVHFPSGIRTGLLTIISMCGPSKGQRDFIF